MTKINRIPSNHVAEWFGHRVFPVVAATSRAIHDQRSGLCPFLSDETGHDRECVKAPNSKGVCTVSSVSKSQGRQDWLVCPIRALDTPLLEDVVRRLFDVKSLEQLEVLPASVLGDEVRRAEFIEHLRLGGRGVVYFQTKLGGEISLPKTERSPEFSFDATMVELVADRDGVLDLGKYGIFEVQTMDYHGSYAAAVQNLRDGLRLHKDDFHPTLAARPDWLAERMEGPNIANVFKRTFYQMMFKFQVGAHESSAGCVFAIPRAVWDSWQRHLAAPELVPRADGTWQLGESSGDVESGRPSAWIYVLDLDVSETQSPNSLDVWRVIATDAKSISHYALDLAPAAALEEGGAVDRILNNLRSRLAANLPELLSRA